MKQHLFIKFLALSILFLQCTPEVILRKAKVDMKKHVYCNAIGKLKKIVTKDLPQNNEIKINLAESYRLTQQYDSAEFYYAQIARLPETEAQPIYYLYYAQMLQINGKCDLAEEWYQKFVKLVPEDLRGQYLSKSCYYQQELQTKNLEAYTVRNAPFNTAKDENQPNLDSNRVVYSMQDAKTCLNSFLFTNGTSVYGVSNTATSPQNVGVVVKLKKSNFKVKNGKPLAFSNLIVSGKKAYFSAKLNGVYSRSDSIKVHNWQIFVGDWENSKLQNVASLPFNSHEYNTLMPSLSPNGSKIYFSSDMPGGFGGLDLYVSEQENGKWGPPTNLGPGVNTEGHEISPSISPSKRLYFASDGHIGLGGFDILYADDKGNSQWSLPENLGAPINSTYNDFGFTINKQDTAGFFSSNRKGSNGHNDIYSFTKFTRTIQVFVYDDVSKLPIGGATVVANKSKNTGKTGKDGKVTFELKFNTCSDFVATLEGYESNHKEGCVKGALLSNAPVVTIPLTPLLKFNVEGIVFDLSTGLPLPASIVHLIKDDNIIKTLTTDASGRYFFALEKGVCYKLKAEKENYLSVTSAESICTNLNESKAFIVNLNLSPQ